MWKEARLLAQAAATGEARWLGLRDTLRCIDWRRESALAEARGKVLEAGREFLATGRHLADTLNLPVSTVLRNLALLGPPTVLPMHRLAWRVGIATGQNWPDCPFADWLAYLDARARHRGIVFPLDGLCQDPPRLTPTDATAVLTGLDLFAALVLHVGDPPRTRRQATRALLRALRRCPETAPDLLASWCVAIWSARQLPRLSAACFNRLPTALRRAILADSDGGRVAQQILLTAAFRRRLAQDPLSHPDTPARRALRPQRLAQALEALRGRDFSQDVLAEQLLEPDNADLLNARDGPLAEALRQPAANAGWTAPTAAVQAALGQLPDGPWRELLCFLATAPGQRLGAGTCPAEAVCNSLAAGDWFATFIASSSAGQTCLLIDFPALTVREDGELFDLLATAFAHAHPAAAVQGAFVGQWLQRGGSKKAKVFRTRLLDWLRSRPGLLTTLPRAAELVQVLLDALFERMRGAGPAAVVEILSVELLRQLRQAASALSPHSPLGRGVGGEGAADSKGPRHPSPPTPLPSGEWGEKAPTPLPSGERRERDAHSPQNDSLGWFTFGLVAELLDHPSPSPDPLPQFLTRLASVAPALLEDAAPDTLRLAAFDRLCRAWPVPRTPAAAERLRAVRASHVDLPAWLLLLQRLRRRREEVPPKLRQLATSAGPDVLRDAFRTYPDAFAEHGPDLFPLRPLLRFAFAHPRVAHVLEQTVPRSTLVRELDWVRRTWAQAPSISAALELALCFSLRDARFLSQLGRKAGPPPSPAERGRTFDHLYHTFERPKKSGGTRTINAPLPRLKRLQRRLLANGFAAVPLHPAAHGFRLSASILTNATPHVGRPLVVNLDVKTFFSGTPYALILRACRVVSAGRLSPRALFLLADLCSCGGALPTGAPTSPAIGNIILTPVDRALATTAVRHGATYTRYADDLTLSGPGETHRLIPFVKQVLGQLGYRIERKKINLFRRGRRQMVTGLVVNDRAAWPRHLRKKLRAAVDRRARGLTPVWQGQPLGDEQLRGLIAFLNLTAPQEAANLRARLPSLYPQRSIAP